MGDKKEKCGVFGILNHPEASNLTYLGLYALQHRGQEAAGIVSVDNGTLREEKEKGRVLEIFNEEKIRKLSGNLAVGHNRYSTFGDKFSYSTIQPFIGKTEFGFLILSHNGNLIKIGDLIKELEEKGIEFDSKTNGRIVDSELILRLIEISDKKTLIEKIKDALTKIKGAYSLVIAGKDENKENVLIGVRDPNGFRPLSIGKRDGSYVIASETCAFNIINANHYRNIKPGELVYIDNKGENSLQLFKENPSLCIFEYIYFARPDSIVLDRSVGELRKLFGRELAKEVNLTKKDIDIVIPIPDSGNYAAVGFSEEKNIPLELSIFRNHYFPGRTFIEPTDEIRDFGSRVKYSIIKYLLKDKKIMLIDDSIVRGKTSKKIVSLCKEAGAKEVNYAVTFSPIYCPCCYGIDFPTKEELVINKMGEIKDAVEKLKKNIDVKTLNYLSKESIIKAIKEYDKKENNKGEYDSFCMACIDGNYPVK